MPVSDVPVDRELSLLTLTLLALDDASLANLDWDPVGKEGKGAAISFIP